jgi:hypothetical protein
MILRENYFFSEVPMLLECLKCRAKATFLKRAG